MVLEKKIDLFKRESKNLLNSFGDLNELEKNSLLKKSDDWLFKNPKKIITRTNSKSSERYKNLYIEEESEIVEKKKNLDDVKFKNISEKDFKEKFPLDLSSECSYDDFLKPNSHNLIKIMSPKVKISPESKKGKENQYTKNTILNDLLKDPFQNKKLFK